MYHYIHIYADINIYICRAMKYFSGVLHNVYLNVLNVEAFLLSSLPICTSVENSFSFLSEDKGNVIVGIFFISQVGQEI